MVKQERARRTYEVILDAAAREFVSLGYARTTLGGVIAHTELSKGALYGHFSSKEDLARTLVRHGATIWGAALADIESARLAPLNALRVLTVSLAGRLWADVRVRAAFRLAAELPGEALDGGPLLTDVWDFLVDSTRRAQAAGEIRTHCSPESVAQLLLSLVVGVQHLPDPQRDAPVKDRIEELWIIIAAALRSPGPAPAPVCDA
ncbi:TetR family transcriptional regulator [Streptomyces lucensis JCM 4490]|uniref:TetR family transcriptional regulator n=1 Tax=Streptomyces lucensis JCM 4490 TaxID=1306176 RepID=A0A918JE81_9ACTN|nr:TetR/AcrR family transcriptional regulator [Streptomyces lucensis]GGW69703.1 TetR family transcriptional regulator [Streptomyces lucensis JCM 4490]